MGRVKLRRNFVRTVNVAVPQKIYLATHLEVRHQMAYARRVFATDVTPVPTGM